MPRNLPKRSSYLLLVVGLGNPGSEYSDTRHNVGFRVVDCVAERRGIRLRKPFLRSFEVGTDGDLTLAKPLTYMNHSGSIIPSLLARSDATASDLFIICDNMDLPPGEVRVKRKGSSGSHNGVASVMAAVGSGEFARVYIGVGRPGDTGAVVDHVLSAPDGAERELIETAIGRAADAVERLAVDGIERVMNDVNSRP